MRIVASFLVIVNHTIGPIHRERGPSITWFVGILAFFICKIAVPLFLMISGAVLLEKQDTPKRIKQRVARVAGTFAMASAAYYLYWGLKQGDTLGIFAFFQKAIQMQTTNALWYMYLYMGFVCFRCFKSW